MANPAFGEKRQGAGAIQDLAEQLSPGERFAFWSAVALYRFGTGRETFASTLHPAPTGLVGHKKQKKQKKPKASVVERIPKRHCHLKSGKQGQLRPGRQR
jgi:hypothetical protein